MEKYYVVSSEGLEMHFRYKNMKITQFELLF